VWPDNTAEALLHMVARRGSMVRSCTVAVVPRPRRIAVRTGTAAADTGCRSAPAQGRLAASKDHLVDKGLTVDKDMGTGKDIRVRPRHQWAHSPANLKSCPVFPFACPSSSLQWYKVLKIIENNQG